jgi:chromosome segregation ATPase
MQEQPIENELQEIKRRLTRLERHTEPIHITRLEIESGSLYRRMDDVQESTNAVQTKIDSMKGDILNIRESQADMKDILKEHGRHFKEIEEKQETHTEILGQLLNIGEATKDDISAIKTVQAEHTKRFDRLEAMMMQILNRLPKAEGE